MTANLDLFSWLDDLNPEQRRAVTHGEGPLLVVAGAGSGKTKTLACRVAYLLAQGVAPGRILLLTFTRRAAQEMLRRAAATSERSGRATGRVWGGTFHSTANRLLRIYAKAAGLHRDFTVMDQGDSEDLLDLVRRDLGLQSRERRFPRKETCLSIYSRSVNGSQDLHEVLFDHFPWCASFEKELRGLFAEYVKRKQKRRVVDYDDLLLYWAELVSKPDLGEEIGGRFDHILVDEYQDTNRVQAAILRGMRRKNHNIMVVGDDAQSIYSFRAATVRNMLDFPKEFPGTTIVTLEENYRSVEPILETTNRVIACAAERYTKDLWSARGEGERPRLVTCGDEAEQDEYVIERILDHYDRGIPLRRQAVLFRASHLSASLELELGRRNIPYHKYGGLRFLEASHVKDLVAFLRIAENPRDELAWLRTLELLEGVGPATAGRAIEHVTRHRYSPRALSTFEAPAAAREGIAGLASLMEDLAAAGPLHPASQVERIRVFYDPLLERRYDNSTVRARDLESLERIAAGYRSRRDFLVDLELDPPTSTSDLAGGSREEEDFLVLSTIHSAKGCEWDAVYLVHASEGALPSDFAMGKDEEIEEELRLAYVALTRARDFLYVLWPLRSNRRWYAYADGQGYAQLSRFFPEDVRKTMEEVFLERPVEEDAPSPAQSEDDIAARIRSMWEIEG